MLVLGPGEIASMFVPIDWLPLAIVVAVVVATAYWVLVITGLRLALPFARGVMARKAPRADAA